MNTIQITDKYRLASDSRSWMIQKYDIQRDKAGEIISEWRSISWHNSPSQAIDSLSKRMLREAATTSLAGLRAEAVRIEGILKSASEEAVSGLH